MLMLMNIDETLDKIYSYVDYSLTHAENVPEGVFTIDKTRKLLRALGNPQTSFSVIHVAGTKGKGSVCAMIAAALCKAGFSVGLYTSPHLIKFNERIIVDNKMINDEELIALTEKVTALVDEDDPVSTFELTTAMAFEYFREKKIDIAVVETGLGGRLDATNVVDPLLTVITSISLDHMSFLGDTIEEISREKAGILKPAVPVICAPQVPEAERVIWRTAAERGCPWIYVPDRFRYINTEDSLDGQKIMIWRPEDQQIMNACLCGFREGGWSPLSIRTPLVGFHQMQNAATVFAVLTKIKSIYTKINILDLLAGVPDTFWPCRFEKINEAPLVFTDGAHNKDSAEKLAATIDRYLGNRPVKCIFGASADKQCHEMIKTLAPHVSEFIVTRSTHPRSADPADLRMMAWECGRKCRLADSLEAVLPMIDSDDEPDTCFVVTGSLFVAAGIRELFMNRNSSIRYFASREKE